MPLQPDVLANSMNLQAKLNGLLDLVNKRGGEIAYRSEYLATKIAGSIPSPGQLSEMPTPPANIHDLVDRIATELKAVFDNTQSAIERAHGSVGDFEQPQGIGKCLNNQVR